MQPFTMKMVPAKVAFFFFYASLGCYAPFMPVLLVSTGLTVRETGLILGLAFVAGTLFPLLFGLIADATRFKMVLFNSILFAYAALHFSLPFAAYFAKHTSSTNISFFNTTKVMYGTNASVSTLSHRSTETKFDNEFNSNLFFALLVITLLGRGFQLSFMGILDSIISNAIQHIGTSESYGQQVMFSGLGVALGSVVSTAVSEKYPKLMYSSYMGNFYTFLPCLMPLVPMLFLIYKETSWNVSSRHIDQNEIQNQVPVETSDGVSDDLPNIVLDVVLPEVTREATDSVPDEGHDTVPDGVINPNDAKETKTHTLLGIFKNPDNIIVMLTVIVCGLLRTVSVSFIYLFMREEIHASKIEIGLAEGVQSLSEFAIFLLSNIVIKTFRGPTICMGTGVSLYCITLLGVSFTRTPWIAILLQVIQGTAFGLFRAANVRYTSDTTPEESYNTMFLLNICFFIGIPGLIGNFAGGILYYKFGGAALFQGGCILGCVWLLIMLIYFMTRRRFKNISTAVHISELQGTADSSGISGQSNENFDTME